MGKPQLALAEIQTLLDPELGSNAANLAPLATGMESQAFSFDHEGQGYILRLNESSEGFEKDEYAFRHFRSDKIPIPRVLKIGRFEGRCAFCLSEKIAGVTLESLASDSIARLLHATAGLWLAIGQVDLSATSGFGHFDLAGNGRFMTWRDCLRSFLERDGYDWLTISAHGSTAIVNRMLEQYEALIEHCPEERRLVHGDFGSNNVLVHDGQITAVLDWGDMLYGDPLYDVATAYFWRTQERSMDLQAAYFEERLSGLPNYHQRITCYQLRAALDEIYDNVLDHRRDTLDWVIGRSSEILS
jgi:hygromycin-B 4-O-kinase